MMKIAVIGGGVSGITFAVNRKKNHPQDEILVFEHGEKLLRKILSTGNGKCNIANAGEIDKIYNSDVATTIISKYNYQKQNEFLDSLNIKTKLVGNLSYPISESAVTVRNAFLKAVEEFGIKCFTSTQVLDYKKIDKGYIVQTNDGEHKVDVVVFACGGKSSPKLGSDGSIFESLKKHGYKVKELNPALCPIYTKEKTKILDGTRVKAEVALLDGSKEIFRESGELLFKEHGLSGIVIFNASRIIAQNPQKPYRIQLDLLPDISVDELKKFLKNNDKNSLLESYLHPNLAKYLSDREDIIQAVKSLTFTFDRLYGFDNSQISVGGLDLNEVDAILQSKKEKGIYFLGEMLDIDAPCGGYNLMWAIGSALFVSENIK